MNTLYCTLKKCDNFIQLPLTLDLKNKSVGLVDINGYYWPRIPGNKTLYLCCDIVKNNGIISRISDSNVYPILRQLVFKSAKSQRHPGNLVDDDEQVNYMYDRIKETYNKILFLPCHEQKVDTLRLYLIDENGNLPSFHTCELNCTLLIYHGNSRTISK